MIASYADANKRIDKVLEFFIVGCASAVAIATIHGHPRLAIILLFLGLIGYAIEAWPSRSSFKERLDVFGSKSQHVVSTNVLETAADAFCCKFLRFSFLLAVTAFLAGYFIGSPLWSSSIAGIFTWFISSCACRSFALLAVRRTSNKRSVVEERIMPPLAQAFDFCEWKRSLPRLGGQLRCSSSRMLLRLNASLHLPDTRSELCERIAPPFR